MEDDHFQHMLKLSTIYIHVLKSRNLFQDFDQMDDADIHNTLNGLEIVADTFVEMQSRLNVRPRFVVKASHAALWEKEGG